MGSVVRGRGGRWKAKYRDPHGNQRYKTFERAEDARRFLNEVETDKIRGNWADPKLGKTRFDDWVEQWWETTLNLRPSTRIRDESYLKNYILPWFGSQQLAKITPLSRSPSG